VKIHYQSHGVTRHNDRIIYELGIKHSWSNRYDTTSGIIAEFALNFMVY